MRGIAAGVAAGALLTACGRFETRAHPFPESIGEASPSASPSASPPGRGTGASPAPTGSVPADRLPELPANELLRRAKTASGTITTVHATADVYDDGAHIVYDVRADLRSEDFTGTMTVSAGRLEIRRIGSDGWIKGDASFWRKAGAPPETASALARKYVHVQEGADAWSKIVGMIELARPGPVLDQLRVRDKLPEAGVDGKRCVQLSGRDNKRTMTLSLSLDDGLLPVRLADDDRSAMTWGEYGIPVDVDRPPASQVIEAPEGDDIDLPVL
jgi:hypothetical protein